MVTAVLLLSHTHLGEPVCPQNVAQAEPRGSAPQWSVPLEGSEMYGTVTNNTPLPQAGSNENCLLWERRGSTSGGARVGGGI